MIRVQNFLFLFIYVFFTIIDMTGYGGKFPNVQRKSKHQKEVIFMILKVRLDTADFAENWKLKTL